jgi:hypothetical protein
MVWEGAELDPSYYVIELLASEIENIRAAVVYFKCEFLQGLTLYNQKLMSVQ